MSYHTNLQCSANEWISGECTIVIEAFFQIGRLLWMYAGYYLNQQQQVVQEGWIDTLSCGMFHGRILIHVLNCYLDEIVYYIDQ
ncbi:hypothetical protein ACHAWU_003771 [Discostella pseudostelligera]|uniref:Uncharacterized protein n=1 Tax=Discostella pseudostelligera TaxID=259834 RepID=A0ABD3MLG5_9STRA